MVLAKIGRHSVHPKYCKCPPPPPNTQSDTSIKGGSDHCYLLNWFFALLTSLQRLTEVAFIRCALNKTGSFSFQEVAGAFGDSLNSDD